MQNVYLQKRKFCSTDFEVASLPYQVRFAFTSLIITSATSYEDDCQCPYVCELLATSKDSENLYFFMPLYAGGPLHMQLREKRSIEIGTAVGYIAELITAVMYIVSQLITKCCIDCH